LVRNRRLEGWLILPDGWRRARFAIETEARRGDLRGLSAEVSGDLPLRLPARRRRWPLDRRCFLRLRRIRAGTLTAS